MIISKYRFLDIKYLLCKKIWLTIKGKISHNLIKVFYVKWTNNFGDLLSPIILKYYGFTPVYAYPNRADIVVVGTILPIIKPDFRGYILGSGWDKNTDIKFNYAKIWGVRGYLTLKSIGESNNNQITIGDPGLIISQIFTFRKTNKYIIGIIPHESEMHDPRIKLLKKNFGNKCTIIYPQNKNIRQILRHINECQYIASSSLHGLIISDSYGIPNCRIKLNELDDSKDYKFRDYYSSLGESLNTHLVTGEETIYDLIKICRVPPTNKINEIKKDIDIMFTSFKKHFQNETDDFLSDTRKK